MHHLHLPRPITVFSLNIARDVLLYIELVKVACGLQAVHPFHFVDVCAEFCFVFYNEHVLLDNQKKML